jgi:hypothetical protein
MKTYQLSTVYEESIDTTIAYIENDDLVLAEVHINYASSTFTLELPNSSLDDFAVLNSADMIRQILNALFDNASEDTHIAMFLDEAIEIQL